MKDLYSLSDFLLKENDYLSIDTLVQEFNDTFVSKDEMFNKNKMPSLQTYSFNNCKDKVEFSSFNAIDKAKRNQITFPLVGAFNSRHIFIKKDDEIENLYQLIESLKKSYNLNIKYDHNIKNDVVSKFSGFIKPKITLSYSDEIFLANGTTKKLNSCEILVKTIDIISNSYVQQLFSKIKTEYPDKVKTASQFMTDYLILTKLKFSDEMIKHKLCKAVGLQLCNKLNNCDDGDIKIIKEVAKNISSLMESMLSKEEIDKNKELLFNNLSHNEETTEINKKPLFNKKKNLIDGCNKNNENTINPIENKFKEKKFTKAFDEEVSNVCIKQISKYDKQTTSNNQDENVLNKTRRLRRIFSYFNSKYNLLVKGKCDKVDKYCIDDTNTLSDETKAFILANKIFDLRNEIINYIEKNYDTLKQVTIKKKFDYVCSIKGYKLFRDCLAAEITDRIKSIVYGKTGKPKKAVKPKKAAKPEKEQEVEREF